MGLSWALVVLVCLVSMVGIQDYLIRNREFWNVVENLERSGVRQQDILGGHAHAGIYRFTPIYRPDFKRRPKPVRAASWNIFMDRLRVIDPVNPPKYVVSFGPIPGFQVTQRFPYQSWLRSGAIVVLMPEKQSHSMPNQTSGIN
jgi:hypothetical protein